MKVTKLNFKYLYPQISKILSECDYIAIDMEFSGTASKKELTNTKYDDINLRYFKLKESTKNYLPLQFGLCGMKIKNEIELFPMNFYIFPHVSESSSRKFTFDMGSVKFLSNNMFDFNKTFYDGVPFVSINEYDKNKFQKNQDEKKKRKKETKIFPPEAKLFTISIYNPLKKFVENFAKKNFNYQSSENLFQIEINNVRKIMLEYFMANLNNLFKIDDKNILFDVEIDETNITKTILKLKITNEKLLKEKSSILDHEKNFKKISSWVYYQSMAMMESDDQSHEIIWKKILTNLVYKNLKSENSEFNNAIENYLNDKNTDIFEHQKYIKEIKNILKNNPAKIKFDSKFYKDLSNFILEFDNLDEFHKVGFTKVISDLIKNKKILIFHNGILDLLHLIDKFIEPLPETYDEFVKLVNVYFPDIYDTKYMIENNSSLFSIFPQSSLDVVYNKIISGLGVESLNSISNMEEIKINQNFSYGGNDYQLFDPHLQGVTKIQKNTNPISPPKVINSTTDDSISILDESIPISNLPRHINIKEGIDEENLSEINFDSALNDPSSALSLRTHEAGYDAMLTCYVFVFLFKYLSNNKYPFLDKNSQIMLEMFKNKMLFSGLQFFCDFNRKKLNENISGMSQRFEIFVLLDLPELITADELKNNFKISFGMNPIIYKLFGQNMAYVIFTKTWEREEFIKMKKEGEDSFILAKLYLHEYKKDSPIVSYSKYVKTIKSDLDLDKIFKEFEKC